MTSRSRTSLALHLRRRERVRLDRGAERDHLVRVDALARLAPEELPHRPLHARHAGHPADQDHLADLAGPDAGVLERPLGHRDAAVHEVLRELLELLARRAACRGGGRAFPSPPPTRNGRWIAVARRADDSSHFAFSAASLQPLQRHPVLAEVDAAVLLREAEGEPVHHPPVEVLAAEVGVAAHRDDVVDALRRCRGSRRRTCRRRGRRPRPCSPAACRSRRRARRSSAR